MAGKYFESFEHLQKPDPVYKNANVSKFVNCIMREGKRTLAQRIVYGAFDLMKKRLADKDPLEVFETAVENVKPMVEVRSKRVGGANYQVPIPVNRKRQQSLAFRWIINATRGAKGRPMGLKLADELFMAARNEGAAIQTKDQTHRMAEANKAFAHYAR